MVTVWIGLGTVVVVAVAALVGWIWDRRTEQDQRASYLLTTSTTEAGAAATANYFIHVQDSSNG